MTYFVMMGALGAGLLVYGLMARQRAKREGKDPGGDMLAIVLGGLLLLGAILSRAS